MALFAWYYLGYGSPDDAISTSGVFSKIPIIGAALDATNEDIALSILYSVYGIPNSGDWGDYPNKWNPNSANSYMTTGIMGYLNSLVVHTSNTASWVKNVYDVLVSIFNRQLDIYNKVKDVISKIDTLVGRVDSTNKILGDIYARQLEIYNKEKEIIGKLNDHLPNITKGLKDNWDVLADIYARQLEIYNKEKDIITIINDRFATANQHLSNVYEVLADIYARQLEIYNKEKEIIGRFDTASQYLSPMSERLDDIVRLLSPSSRSDALDTFLGDFDLPASSALSAQVQAALQSAFPFCIPAILKQVLGILDAEPLAARVDFDIMGASVSLDFDAQGVSQVATVTSWLCRIFFVVLLLSCSPRFIVSHPGRGS